MLDTSTSQGEVHDREGLLEVKNVGKVMRGERKL